MYIVNKITMNREGNMFFQLMEYFLIFLFPIREALGFSINSTPVRLGEIFIGIYVVFSIPIILKKKSKVNWKSAVIILLLFINLVFTILVSLFSDVDKVFLLKYLIRNVLILFFITFICLNPLKINANVL